MLCTSHNPLLLMGPNGHCVDRPPALVQCPALSWACSALHWLGIYSLCHNCEEFAGSAWIPSSQKLFPEPVKVAVVNLMLLAGCWSKDNAQTWCRIELQQHCQCQRMSLYLWMWWHRAWHEQQRLQGNTLDQQRSVDLLTTASNICWY